MFKAEINFSLVRMLEYLLKVNEKRNVAVRKDNITLHGNRELSEVCEPLVYCTDINIPSLRSHSSVYHKLQPIHRSLERSYETKPSRSQGSNPEPSN